MAPIGWTSPGTASIPPSASASLFSTNKHSESLIDLKYPKISAIPAFASYRRNETGDASHAIHTVRSGIHGILNGTDHTHFDYDFASFAIAPGSEDVDIPETDFLNLTDTFNSTDPNATSTAATSISEFEGKFLIIPLYTMIFFLSFFGNLMVILTLARNRRMRTVTNVLLLNLAVSDLLLGVFCMPVTLIGQLLRNFIFGPLMCRIIPYFQAISVSVGVWTLVAISLERYFAICRPLQSRKWQTRSHAYKMILAVWLFTLTWNLPITFVSALQPIRNSGRYKCREMWPTRQSEKIFNLILDFLLLLCPLCIMGLAYSLIMCKLWKGLQSEIRHTRSFRHHGTHGHLIPTEESFEMTARSHYSGCTLCTNEAPGPSSGCRPCTTANQCRECSSNEIVTLQGGKGVVVRWRRKNDVQFGNTSAAAEGSSNHRLNGGQQRPKTDYHRHHHQYNANHCTQSLTNQHCQRHCQHHHHHAASTLNQESNMVRAIRSTYTGKSMESKKKVIRMLFVLVAEFFVCWTPLYVMNTWYLFDREAVYNHIGTSGVALVQLLAYISSCCNPITYCFMNRKFRQAFIKVFQCPKTRTVIKTGPQTLGRGSDVSPNDSLVYGAPPSTLNKSAVYSSDLISKKPLLQVKPKSPNKTCLLWNARIAFSVGYWESLKRKFRSCSGSQPALENNRGSNSSQSLGEITSTFGISELPMSTKLVRPSTPLNSESDIPLQVINTSSVPLPGCENIPLNENDETIEAVGTQNELCSNTLNVIKEDTDFLLRVSWVPRTCQVNKTDPVDLYS